MSPTSYLEEIEAELRPEFVIEDGDDRVSLTARWEAGWATLSVPRGGSVAFNADPKGYRESR